MDGCADGEEAQGTQLAKDVDDGQSGSQTFESIRAALAPKTTGTITKRTMDIKRFLVWQQETTGCMLAINQSIVLRHLLEALSREGDEIVARGGFSQAVAAAASLRGKFQCADSQ
eukprot:3238995-Amphidinium_carterae.1